MSNFFSWYKHKTNKDHPIAQVCFHDLRGGYKMDITFPKSKLDSIFNLNEKDFEEWLKDFEEDRTEYQY